MALSSVVSPSSILAAFPAPTALASAAGGKELDLFQLVLSSGGVVLFVLFLLIVFFVVTTFVIGYKIYQLGAATSETDVFLDNFYKSKRLEEVYERAKQLRRSPVAAMFRAGFLEQKRLSKQAGDAGTSDEGGLENIERALRRSSIAEMTVLESLTPFLATVGSSAPFVGLFGTVWGIMDSFRNIGAKGSANLATVAPGIAEALIATAIGLVAAIPAVMAYNYFARRIKVLTNEMDTFHNDFLNLVKRNYLR